MPEKHIAREAYLESPQRYMMELFCKRANDFKPSVLHLMPCMFCQGRRGPGDGQGGPAPLTPTPNFLTTNVFYH